MPTSSKTPTTLQDDFQYINQQLFLLAREHGERLLASMNASTPVARLIMEASKGGMEAAVQCRVPLVTFNDSFKKLVLKDPSTWPRDNGVKVPESFRAFTRFVLQFALDVVHAAPTIAQLCFGLDRPACEAYGHLSHRHLNEFSQHARVPLQILGGERRQDWDRLLIGNRVSGPMALQISHQMALLMLAARR